MRMQLPSTCSLATAAHHLNADPLYRGQPLCSALLPAITAAAPQARITPRRSFNDCNVERARCSAQLRAFPNRKQGGPQSEHRLCSGPQQVCHCVRLTRVAALSLAALPCCCPGCLLAGAPVAPTACWPALLVTYWSAVRACIHAYAGHYFVITIVVQATCSRDNHAVAQLLTPRLLSKL